MGDKLTKAEREALPPEAQRRFDDAIALSGRYDSGVLIGALYARFLAEGKAVHAEALLELLSPPVADAMRRAARGAAS